MNNENRAKLCGAPKGGGAPSSLLIGSIKKQDTSFSALKNSFKDMKNKKETQCRSPQRTEIRFYDTPISQHPEYLREEVSVNLIFPLPF